MKRKLTTIMVADAEGYSALMEADEAATLDRLQRYRSIMSGLFERHDGRWINTWGDAVIAEFSSVVEAIRCAVEIQDSITTENHVLPKAQQMWFRIGINLGDVMIDGDDLYGDGVNVAARLQTLAEPGGIVVSGTVYSLAHKQLALAFDFVGNQDVKNIGEPVPSYRVRMAGRNQPDSARKPEARREAEKPAPGERERPAAATDPRISGLAARADRVLTWVRAQPRGVRRAVTAIAVLFGINLVTDGLANPWFLYPSVPLAIFILLRHERPGDRAER